jgi:hypothetical protein
MGGSNISVFSTISSHENTTNNIRFYSIYGRKEGLEAVDAADVRLIMVRDMAYQ